jgi:hypothetical protein
MTRNKKWFSSLSPLSHKEYATFGDDIIKVNDHFTLNDVAFVDKLRYNLFSVSQLIDADLDVLFCKSSSHVLDSSMNDGEGDQRAVNGSQSKFSWRTWPIS